MIHCKKTPVGYQVEINGPGNDVVKESLHIIQSVYEACADNSKQEAEMLKSLSSPQRWDWMGFVSLMRRAIRCVSIAAHCMRLTGTEGTFDGGSEEMPR